MRSLRHESHDCKTELHSNIFEARVPRLQNQTTQQHQDLRQFAHVSGLRAEIDNEEKKASTYGMVARSKTSNLGHWTIRPWEMLDADGSRSANCNSHRRRGSQLN